MYNDTFSQCTIIEAELTDHLGWDKHAPRSRGTPASVG